MGWFSKKVEPEIGDTITYQDSSLDTASNIATRQVIGRDKDKMGGISLISDPRSPDGTLAIWDSEVKQFHRRRR